MRAVYSWHVDGITMVYTLHAYVGDKVFGAEFSQSPQDLMMAAPKRPGWIKDHLQCLILAHIKKELFK